MTATESPSAVPPLLHIGYPKTGSTWLQERFFSDPRTGLRWLGKAGDHPVREIVLARPFCFDVDALRRRFAPLLRAIEAEGLHPVVSFERLVGHPDSGGYDGESIARRLADLFPGARVLVFVREQRAMIASTYKHYVKTGGPCSLHEFLRPVRSPSLRVPWFDLAYYEYHHLLRAYRQLFGADAVLALPYEQFLTMPERMLENIAAFAGRPLDVGVAASLRPRHPKHGSHSAATTEVWRRVNRLVARSELHQAPLISSSWLEHVARRAIKRAARSPRLLGRPSRRLDERLYRQVAELVGDRYVESNRVTAELIGVDLAAYGWAL